MRLGAPNPLGAALESMSHVPSWPDNPRPALVLQLHDHAPIGVKSIGGIEEALEVRFSATVWCCDFALLAIKLVVYQEEQGSQFVSNILDIWQH